MCAYRLLPTAMYPVLAGLVGYFKAEAAGVCARSGATHASLAERLIGALVPWASARSRARDEGAEQLICALAARPLPAH
ncbi:hypothetical protein AE924_14240, partial [Xanthomonas arboricola]